MLAFSKRERSHMGQDRITLSTIWGLVVEPCKGIVNLAREDPLVTDPSSPFSPALFAGCCPIFCTCIASRSYPKDIYNAKYSIFSICTYSYHFICQVQGYRYCQNIKSGCFILRYQVGCYCGVNNCFTTTALKTFLNM